MQMADDYVTLVSAEGFEFVIERRCALMSGTIKAMLTGVCVCVCVYVCKVYMHSVCVRMKVSMYVCMYACMYA